ncbi:ankyrin-1-like [Panicum virgatum]|uniref:ankyrin-1-like n=1 Tax=Panicum virgatum TaxID=38727 RepID=UPI0019D5D9B0|nr:ankyrin-1-like [Panicum virgatum]
MDRQQQQHIQLACPPRGPLNDGARSVQMCPSLYLATYRGRLEEVMALLLQQHGAGTAGRYQATGIIQHGQCDLLEVTAERNTILHVAAEQGHDELIRELYIRFREEGLLFRRNSALDTPLHCAARAGHARAVAALVQLAQSILGCKNEAGDTALHLAARCGHGAAVEVLVSEAAATELNNAGVSALYLAVMSGSIQAVRAITSTCRDASSAGPSSISQNALHAAVFQSSGYIVLACFFTIYLA